MPTGVSARSASAALLPGHPLSISALWFTAPTDGWLGGNGTIRHTADGGRTWQTQRCGPGTVRALDFINAQDGWAVTSGPSLLLRTTDGGAKWKAVAAPAGSLRSLSFVNGNDGFAIEPAFSLSALVATTDGGASWHPVPIPATAASAACFENATVGFVASIGTQGLRLWRTEDGGRTWLGPVNVGGPDAGAQLSCSPPQGAWLLVDGDVGMSQESYSVFHTVDGATWTAVAALPTAGAGPAPGSPKGVPEPPLMVGPRIQALPSGQAYLIGECFVCDRGNPQVRGALLAGSGPVATLPPLKTPAHLGAWFATSASGLWLALPSNGDVARILDSSDGGAAWSTVYEGAVRGPVKAITFPTPELGYGLGISGDSRAVLRTQNAGQTWSRVGEIPASPSGTRQGSASPGLVFTTAQVGFAVSGQGVVWQTGNGGRAWRRADIAALASAHDPRGLAASMAFATPRVGCVQRQGAPSAAVGYRFGGFVGTTDGGRTWRTLSWRPPAGLSDSTAYQQTLGCAIALADIGTPASVPGPPASFGAPVWPDAAAAMTAAAETLSRDGAYAYFYITDNTGRTWTRYAFDPRVPLFGEVALANAEDGWVLGAPGVLLQTTDGGAVWRQLASRVLPTASAGA